MSEAPKRPLAHASLSGSFILVATIGFVCLLFSILCTAVGWLSEDGKAVVLVPPSATVPAQDRGFVDGWQSLKLAASNIERSNLSTAHSSSEATQSYGRLRRPFGLKLTDKLGSMIAADRIDNVELVRLYLEYESHYIEKSGPSAYQRIGGTLDWLRSSRADRLQSNISNWMVGLHSRLIGASNIVYNKDYNLVSRIPDSRRLQCQSASVAMALAAMVEPIPAAWRPVFVHSHGHVQFGILSGRDIYIVEGTSMRSEVLRHPLVKLKNRQVTDARLTLLESMAVQASLGDQWQASRWLPLLELFNHGSAPIKHNRGTRETAQGPSLSRSAGGGHLVEEGDQKRGAVGAPLPHGVMRPDIVTSAVKSSSTERYTARAFQDDSTPMRSIDANRGYGSRLVGRVGVLQPSESKLPADIYKRRSRIHIGNIGGATSGGERFAESVRGSILRHRADIAKCYEQALLQSPQLRGALILELKLNQHMDAPVGVAVETSIKHVSFKDCVSNVANNVRLPRRPQMPTALRLPIFFNRLPMNSSNRRL